MPAGFPVIQAPVFCVPAAEIADGLGTTKAANMVLLGALLELTHALPKETSFVVLKSNVRNVRLLEVDCCAIDAGMESVRKQLNAAGSGLYSREEALVPCK